jgi:ribosomal protein S18 acetylase RimI-like enzyme
VSDGGAPSVIRRLDASDAAAFRDIRLAGLRDDPAAFGATFEEEAALPPAAFADRLARNAVYGAEGPDGRLDGTCGLFVQDTAKLRHKGVVWGLFVRPEARGRGLGLALVRRVIAEAAGSVEELRLAVGAGNLAASRLYFRLGFRAHGREPRAMRVGGAYLDEVLMHLPPEAMVPPQ